MENTRNSRPAQILQQAARDPKAGKKLVKGLVSGKHSRVGNVWIIFWLLLALIADLLSLIPFVGDFVSPVFWFAIAVFLWKKGCGFLNVGRLATELISFVAELIPVVQEFPIFIIGTFLVMLLIRFEDVTGLKIAGKISSGGMSSLGGGGGGTPLNSGGTRLPSAQGGPANVDGVRQPSGERPAGRRYDSSQNASPEEQHVGADTESAGRDYGTDGGESVESDTETPQPSREKVAESGDQDKKAQNEPDNTKTSGWRERQQEELQRELDEPQTTEETTRGAQDQPQAKSLPADSLESDPRYRDILEEASLDYLMNEDREWFLKNYSGKVAASGYLIDVSGNETNVKPSQTVGDDGWNLVKNMARNEFAERFRADAEAYENQERNRNKPRV